MEADVNFWSAKGKYEAQTWSLTPQERDTASITWGTAQNKSTLYRPLLDID